MAGEMWADNTTRKPLLLLRLSGLFLLRLAARAFSGLLIQEPPRSTPVIFGAPDWQNQQEHYAKNNTTTASTHPL